MGETVAFHIGETFESFEQLTQKLHDFEQYHFTQYYFRHSRTIRAALGRCPKKVIRDALRYTELTLACIHGGKPFKSKGEGKRPNQSTFKQGCPASIKLSASTNGQFLVVRKVTEEHNHEINKSVFKNLPKQRKLSPESRAGVKALLSLSARKKQHLMGVSSQVIPLKDLHNLAAEGSKDKAEGREFPQDMDSKPTNILIGCTGSVASIKVPEIVTRLQCIHPGINVQVITTQRALHFFDVADLGEVKVHEDEDEWTGWAQRGDPVLHIELRRWADVLLIAPLDANTLAKIANGICDNLLTCVVRAWDMNKPLFFAPAMNTCMWDHPLTGEQVRKLQEWGYREIPCIDKTLMCGDQGMGAMATVDTLVDTIAQIQ